MESDATFFSIAAFFFLKKTGIKIAILGQKTLH